MIAIDNDADFVATAQELGVEAQIAVWPDFEDGQFDAVLFSRSLHHIHPLDKALQRAADGLVIGGRVIVEDFAYETADEKTLQWFADVIDQLDDEGVLIRGDDFLHVVLSKTETTKAWRENHELDLHTAGNVLAEIRRVFGETHCEEAPYYFRYLSHGIVPTADRDKILQNLAQQDARLIARSMIVPLGRRFVAERRNRS